MSLSIVYRRNTLATCKAPFVIHSACADTVTMDELVDEMASAKSTMSRADFACAMEVLAATIAKLVADGKFVQMLLGSFYLSASGTLDTADQPFTPRAENSNHDLQLHFRPNRALGARLIAMAKLERSVHTDKCSPYLVTARTVRTKTQNVGNAGELLRIEGERLAFDDGNEATGLFFVNGKETRADYYVVVKPGLVIAEIPATLPSGQYTLVIRSMADSARIREGRHETIFTVA